MIWIVSGAWRCLTSGMMHALINGGMEAEYDERRNKMNEIHGEEGYLPNPDGFFEPAPYQFREWNFPLRYQGKLLKILFAGVSNLAVNQDGYRVIFMRRGTGEVRRSYLTFFEKYSQYGTSAQLYQVFNNFQYIMELHLEKIRNRKDVLSCHEIWFKQVIDKPHEVFTMLKHSGWPIDVDKAAATIDKKQHRFKEVA